MFLLIVSFSLFANGEWADNDSKAVVKIEEKELSAFSGLNLETKTKEGELFTSSISTPITKSDALNSQINAWIQKQQNEFMKEVKINEAFINKDKRAHLNINIDTAKVNDHIYSLTLESYQYTGRASGKKEIQPFTINLETEKVLALQHVVKDNTEKKIASLVKKEILADNNLVMYVFEDILNEVLKEPSEWKWSLNKDGFTLHFDESEIAAGAAGSVNIEIPIEKMAPYLDEEILEGLKEKTVDELPEEVTPDNVDLDPDKKVVALTFDDGPHPKVTPEILSTLDEFDAKATFFMLGNQAEYYPSVAQEVAQEGHEIGNHTTSHMNLTNLNKEEIIKEIQTSNQLIKKASGQTPSVFRPPYGAFNEDVKEYIKEKNTPLVLWSVDSLDWQSRNANDVNKKVKEEIVSGSIILLHDIHPSTAEALPKLLESLEREGYQFITISQLLSLQGQSGVGPHYGKTK
ncbi:polysaccharide deacetylase family protein [Rossellomorea oryzaecorticis]